jgi:murein DD-endopeptidase MepM/ murein hydrolase activator NlpD
MTEKNKSRTTSSAPRPGLPRVHLALASAALTAVFLALLLPSEQVQANRTVMPLPLELEPQSVSQPQSLALQGIDAASPGSGATGEPAAQANEAAEIFDSSWQEITVRSGDNLAKLFHRAGLNASDLHELLEATPEAATLKRLYPGQKLAFQVDAEGGLQSLRYDENHLTTTQYVREAKSFVAEKIVREPEVRRQFVQGTIDSSLFKAAADAGLPNGMILQLANIFGGVVDFVLDIRANDRFLVLYEELWLDDQKVGNGQILAATFVNQGKSHTAFRYEDSDGTTTYYSPDGVSMRKAFLRAPLDFTRVTSNFNPSRMHPILKISRPHRGIDYGAPTGTPVYAAGDGRIAQSGFTKPNGNFIVIQHGQQYTTKYLHLQKRAVNSGARVKQGQLIGWVGSTGYATGPHLHYEFLVNGVHRNPATIVDQLPRSSQLAAKERQRFQQQIAPLQTQLAAFEREIKLAAADQDRQTDHL